MAARAPASAQVIVPPIKPPPSSRRPRRSKPAEVN
jgi:hypothetical protein